MLFPSFVGGGHMCQILNDLFRVFCLAGSRLTSEMKFKTQTKMGFCHSFLWLHTHLIIIVLQPFLNVALLILSDMHSLVGVTSVSE